MNKKRGRSATRLTIGGLFPVTTSFNFFDKLQAKIKRLTPSWQACIPLAMIIVFLWGLAAQAQTPTPASPPPLTPEQMIG